MYVSLLILVALSIAVLYLSHRRVYEFFDGNPLSTNSDFVNFMDFHNNQYCKVWNAVMDEAMKNDQVDLPKEQQLSRSAYTLKLQKDYNQANKKNVSFVVCDPLITAELPIKTLLGLVPESAKPYTDSLTFLNDKMDSIIRDVKLAMENEGFTSFQVAFTCESNDKGAHCVSQDKAFTCDLPKTEAVSKEVAQQSQKDTQISVLIQRAKAILTAKSTIQDGLKKAQEKVGQLEAIKEKVIGQGTTLPDGQPIVDLANEKPRQPPTQHLFFN